MPALDPTTIQVKDYLHVKGVRLVEPGMPQWKIKPMQEKNMKLIAEYLVGTINTYVSTSQIMIVS